MRVDGVSDINIQGQRDYSMRIWLDPTKLAARNMTALDVADAIRTQNVDAPAGRIGQPPIASGQAFQFPLDTLGRLTDPVQFGNMIVKIGGRPQVLSPGGRWVTPAGGGAGATSTALPGTSPSGQMTASGTGSSSSSTTQSTTTTDSSDPGLSTGHLHTISVPVEAARTG